ncbi:MAG: radical SAM protein [Nitrospinae bacterium]|nr:radical SAM protein [Nitrospinota bacterium]
MLNQPFYDFEKGKLSILLTSHCNLSCKMCGIIRDANQGMLTRDEAFEIAKFGIGNRFRTIEISGGEPFLVKYIYDLLNYLCMSCDDNTTVFITTNGTLLKRDHINRLAKLRNLHCQISFDGMASYHNKIRGWEHAFERADWAIREMDRRGISVSIASVIQNCNFESIFDLYRYFADVNYKWHAFPLYEPHSTNIDEVRISPDDADRLEYILNEIKNAAEKEKKPVGLSKDIIEYFVGRVKGRDASYIHPGLACTVPRRGIIVNHMGQIFPCFHYDWFKYNVDRSIQKRSISDIVFSKEYRDSIHHAVSGSGCNGCSTTCYGWDPDFSRKIAEPSLTDKILLEIQQSSNYVNNGITFEQQGDFDKALEEYRKSLQNSYNPISSLYHLASLLKRTGQENEALTYFEQMDKYQYNSLYSYYYAQRHFHRGEIYYERGEIHKANEDFMKCIELLPGHKKAKEYLTRITQG